VLEDKGVRGDQALEHQRLPASKETDPLRDLERKAVQLGRSSGQPVDVVVSSEVDLVLDMPTDEICFSAVSLDLVDHKPATSLFEGLTCSPPKVAVSASRTPGAFFPSEAIDHELAIKTDVKLPMRELDEQKHEVQASSGRRLVVSRQCGRNAPEEAQWSGSPALSAVLGMAAAPAPQRRSKGSLVNSPPLSSIQKMVPSLQKAPGAVISMPSKMPFERISDSACGGGMGGISSSGKSPLSHRQA